MKKVKAVFLSIFLFFTIVSSVYSTTDKQKSETRTKWNSALKLLNASGDTFVWSYIKDTKHRLGTRDSIVFLPESASPKDLFLIVWLHGCSGFSDKSFQTRIIPQLKLALSRGYSVAVAVPEMPWSINTTTTCGRQGKVFRKKNSFHDYITAVKLRIDKAFFERNENPPNYLNTIVVGHSAGGSAIMSIARSGGFNKLGPSSVVWSDSTYGRWFNLAWNAYLKTGNSKVYVLIRKWTDTHKQFKKFIRGKKPEDFLKVKIYTGKITHSIIGNNALEYTGIFPERF